MAITVVESNTLKSEVKSAQSVNWQPFDMQRLQYHLDAGRSVFVDVTARWCVTCQFNKKTVIESHAVQQWLKADDVVAMRADWTQPNAEIASYLASFQRYGIPFNVVYGPNAKQGIVLETILKRQAVLAAAAHVKGNPTMAFFPTTINPQMALP